MSAALGVPFLAWQLEAPGLLRHPLSGLWSMWWLARLRPRVILLQHSFLLAVIVAAYKRIMRGGVFVVDDFHTKALRRRVGGARARPFAALRRWSVSSFDLILIATSELEEEARPFGLPVVVLPDPIPGVPPARPNADAPAALRAVVVIASYAVDEPIDQILEAARRCPDLRFSITGEPPSELRGRTPENVELTGYLPHADFQALLGGAACVVALTTEEACFQRGACEALAHARPLVTSDTAALRSYLGEAAVFVEPTALAIAHGVRDALARSSELERAARRRREEIRALDRANLASVLERIDAMAAGPSA